jgi:Domain of unknown function (DUF4157)
MRYPTVTSVPPDGDLLPSSIRSRMEAGFGARLPDDVRLHTGPDAVSVADRARVRAFAIGHDVGFAAGEYRPFTFEGDALLAHELAHTFQASAHGAPGVESAIEHDANRSAGSAVARMFGASHAPIGPPRRAAALGLHGCSKAPPPGPALDQLRAGQKPSAADAKTLLTYYESLGPTDKDSVVTEFHQVGGADSGIRRLFEALDPADMVAKRATMADIQERVQRLAVESSAGKSLTELGAAQGAHMKAEAEKLALAEAAEDARVKGLPPPKAVPPADVARAHEKETKRTSPVTATVTNAWDAIPTKHADWNTRAAAVITAVVAACQKHAPELGITAANLKWAPREIAQEGSNVYASSGNPIKIGMSFVETAEADPEYAVRVVVHEISGHPEFGDRFKSAEALIYAKAHAAEPSLGKPWDTEEEINTFGYLGTEIYAALREVPYEKALTAVDAQKGLITAIDPASNVDNKVGLIKSKYAPGIAEPIVQGLYERLRVDPRISPKALALYVTTVEKHFGKKALK